MVSTIVGYFRDKTKINEFGLYINRSIKFLVPLPGTLVSFWYPCQKFDNQVFGAIFGDRSKRFIDQYSNKKGNC